MECLLVWAPNVAAKLEGIVELRAAPSGRASELVDASPKEDRINYLLDDSMRWMVFRHPSLSVKLFSVSADQTTGAFKILPTNFQNAPGSVLAQLNMPEVEKARLAEKLADGSVRLAAVTVWDTVDEDGDTVDVMAAGFRQRLVIMHKPVTFFLPVQPGGSVVIKAVRDGGGGGVTLGVSTILG